ncbi:hypothetical protein PsorP6_013947 [Peronosclerospora sorghi]|uniref:Uncharacterized protein n=1 Tax=Peronosclerospora sorghi TaxID=230839 RepID=A0ACC0VIA0_9STRA|nr:hypothetical protein PsorP6_013947 [Peronosclerospora sorghi]
MILSALTKSAMAVALLPLDRASSLSAVGYMRHDRESLFTTSNHVRTFDSTNFGAALNDTDTVWLVDFYSPWCPHCRRFAPQLEQLANWYSDVEYVQFGAVDCTKQNEICEQEGIYSYPGVKMYHVPPEAKEGIAMPHEENAYAKDVATWMEETMKQHKMQPGINLDKVHPAHTALSDDPKKKELKFGDPVKPSFHDQSLEIYRKRLHDAGSTVLLTVEEGFFIGATVLEGERYEAAVTWLRALAVGFSMKENRDALAMLVNELKQRQRWKLADWKAVVGRWKATVNVMSYPVNLFADKDDLVLCTTSTCGLWTLFHILTASDFESHSRREEWQASEIMSALCLVVKYFFGCEECKRHFLKTNTDKFIRMLALRDGGGPDALTLWMWVMHNKVNERLSKSMWPTKRSCPQCYIISDQPLSLDPVMLNEQDIAAYVRSVYNFEDKLYKFDDKLEMNQKQANVAFSRRSMATLALLVAILVVFFRLFRHRLSKIRVSKGSDHIA